MATAIAAPTIQTNSQLEKAFTDAQIQLNKAQNELHAEESALATATAQFNEQCRLVASGKKADPDQSRALMNKIEQRIVGLKSIVAERQGDFDRAASERNEAFGEQAKQAADQRAKDIYQKFQSAKRATADAQAALKRAQIDELQAGHQWKLETQRNPSASQLIAHLPRG
jgi:hypothetical protein